VSDANVTAVHVAGWPVHGCGLSERAPPLHGGYRCTEGVVDGLALHGKLLRPRLGASNGGIVVKYDLHFDAKVVAKNAV